MKRAIFFLLCSPLIFLSCNKDEEPEHPLENGGKLIVKLSVDPDQERLGNDGTPGSVPQGNAGQDPQFNQISAHYLELAPDAHTPLGEGEVLYHAPETTKGGGEAIDFDRSSVVEPGEVFFELPLSAVPEGEYKWVRLSLSYQNYDITFQYKNRSYEGTLASFVGYNTYINDYVVKDEKVTVNANKSQGYWGFESVSGVKTGQSPEGATTVPNPLFDTSPIPDGSCVVTGDFNKPLVITGNETDDITLTMSLSTNKSFEWEDGNGNDQWDVTDTSVEQVVDMGLRGLKPSHDR